MPKGILVKIILYWFDNDLLSPGRKSIAFVNEWPLFEDRKGNHSRNLSPHFYQDTVLPEAVTYWSKALRVIRTENRIRLSRWSILFLYSMLTGGEKITAWKSSVTIKLTADILIRGNCLMYWISKTIFSMFVSENYFRNLRCDFREMFFPQEMIFRNLRCDFRKNVFLNCPNCLELLHFFNVHICKLFCYEFMKNLFEISSIN